MMKRKNLERVIVAGIILTNIGMANISFAAKEYDEIHVNNKEQVITETDDVIVSYNGQGGKYNSGINVNADGNGYGKAGSLKIDLSNNDLKINNFDIGVYLRYNAKLNIDNANNITIKVDSDRLTGSQDDVITYGINSTFLNKDDDLYGWNIKAGNQINIENYYYGVNISGKGKYEHNLTAGESIKIHGDKKWKYHEYNTAASGIRFYNGGISDDQKILTVITPLLEIKDYYYGFEVNGKGIIDVKSDKTIIDNGNLTKQEDERYSGSGDSGIYITSGTLNLNATQENTIKNSYFGIEMRGSSANLNMQSKINNIENCGSGILATAGTLNLIAEENNIKNTYYGLEAFGTANINMHGQRNTVQSESNGVYINEATVDLLAQENIVESGKITTSTTDGYTGQFGDQTAVFIENGGKYSLTAGYNDAGDLENHSAINRVSGTVRVEGEKSSANIESAGNNFIYSSAHGKGYGDTNNVAAVFARNEAVVDITGDRNFIATNCGNDDNDEERVIWAQAMGTININGATTIIASRAETNGNGDDYKSNSKGIAITAGSEQIVDDGNGNPVDPDKQSVVNVNYKGQYIGGGSVIQGNYISGDIVSGFNGQVNIGSADKTRNTDDNIYIRGNLLTANGGEVNASLGKNGILIGRVDDYQDVTNTEDNYHTSVYNPIFSNEVNEGGNVSLRMDEGSTWYVAGQSWLTRLDMDGAKINISAQNTLSDKYEKKAHALTIREVTSGSSGTFVMDLNHKDHLQSDMLYIGKVVGDNTKSNTDKYAVNFDIELNSTILGWEDLVNEELRFATVRDEKIGFNKLTLKNEGIYDIEFEIGNEKFTEDDKDNEDYNGSELDPSKPGNDAIVDKEGNKINWFIQGVKDKEENNSAEVIVDMSRANYANAVYMDRLNKRMGEMRYINDEEDTGLWVRMRHDRVGKDDAFKYKSNMYEIGYDEKQACDNGKRRVGVAIDYMHGDTTYSNVGGKGEISRKGVWLYDTWLGDKGHYADYIAKWGHLANDYEIYNLKSGDKITGDYDNNVFSLSAEYGRKKDMGNSWYIEPQAQLQYAYVTDADYRTTQGTDVSLDSIQSLIGRVGFRLGKDTDERSTIYFKADLLHEFLGDQEIYARDKTGEMCKTYDNKGTWYDLGFGFATALNKDSYLYADFERSFGNDNDNTWQVNVGANWSF